MSPAVPGHGDRPQVAGGARAALLQACRRAPHVAPQAHGAHRAALRPIQRPQRVAPIAPPRMSGRCSRQRHAVAAPACGTRAAAAPQAGVALRRCCKWAAVAAAASGLR
eukprot:360817-Chlamydomonas_euryale.AAC.15